MNARRVVSRGEWLEARLALLEQEKALTRARDALARERRELPMVQVEKRYLFTGPDGEETLEGLFAGRSELFVHHFMFGPDWEEGCPSCSFWADSYDGIDVHLAHRDITLVAVSRAPYEKLAAYRRRMGWRFKWVSSLGSDFNFDHGVSFTLAELDGGEVTYNYRRTSFPSEEAPGVSVFFRDGSGGVFHTYSCYSRGLDILNGAYHHMDLVPRGRDEDELEWTMAWLRRHDSYED